MRRTISGPSVLRWTLPLFEGGLLRARLREARAAFDQAAGVYRATVLSAFQEIEDNLALLHWLESEGHQEQEASTAAQQTLDMSNESLSQRGSELSGRGHGPKQRC